MLAIWMNDIQADHRTGSWVLPTAQEFRWWWSVLKHPVTGWLTSYGFLPSCASDSDRNQDSWASDTKGM